ncbi:hypothetical protein Q9L42_013530 [Methylomarinum sp. Ch1-1]|uniref:Uncharacterized protein n=1 Tax=Methylomarinum roseum TaxID=3067653 RepID=A0AAU7NR18_9GAMM
MAIFIEFIIGALLALYFHWMLKYEEAAFIIFGVGVLLSLATYLIREEIVRARRSLANLHHSGYKISEALAAIAEPACREKSRELLKDFRRNLGLLERGCLLLNEAEFYLESAKALEQTKHRVKAVDPMLVNWDSRGALVNYYQANLDALARGVRITRVFVIGRRDCHDPAVQKVLQRQSDDGVDVRIAFREDLPLKNGDGFNGSLDFAVYNDRVVADREQGNQYYFGIKTHEKAEVDKYNRLFDLIEHHAHRWLNEPDSERYLKQFSNASTVSGT